MRKEIKETKAVKEIKEIKAVKEIKVLMRKCLSYFHCLKLLLLTRMAIWAWPLNTVSNIQ